MAEAITFHFDHAQADRALDQLGTRAPVAMARALNRTTTSVRAVLARDIAGDIGLRVGTVRDELKIRRATPEQLTSAVSVSGARIALEKFGASGPLPSRGRGTVSARIGGTRKRYEGAFRATMRSGHTGVFRRVVASTRKSAGAWARNLPIAELFGPSLPQVFGRKVPTTIEQGEQILAKNIEHEIGFELSQSGL